MAFLWGGSPPEGASEESTAAHAEQAARVVLTDIFSKCDPDSLASIDALLSEHKGNLSQLVEDVRRRYSADIRRDEIKQQLLKHYEKHNAAKVGIVEDMLCRFKGKEENLLQEVLRKYPDSKTSVMPALTHAVISSDLNTSLPIHLQDKRIYYSGYLWEKTQGWMGAGVQQRWVMLLAQRLYIGQDPSGAESSYEQIPLAGCTIDDVVPDPEPQQYMFKLTTSSGAERSFYSNNEVDKLMWAVKIDVAVLQANPTRQANAEARDMYHRVFTVYPLCPAVPFFNDRLTVVPEKLDTPLLHSALVAKTGDSWLGENWGRRYVTLHSCYFTLRPDKASAYGTRLVPLRDADVRLDKGLGHISVSTKFEPSVTFAPDSPADLARWHAAFESAVDAANPQTAGTLPGRFPVGGVDSGEGPPPPPAEQAATVPQTEAETPEEASVAAPDAADTDAAAAASHVGEEDTATEGVPAASADAASVRPGTPPLQRIRAGSVDSKDNDDKTPVRTQ
eukprot:Rhum_TRINITY_DN20922_c0_g1::Rhum_TRINITY_DN20922_c0_g1_i1::g.172628::m.172628